MEDITQSSSAEILKAVRASLPKGIRNDMLASHVCKHLASYCSVLFIKWRLIPNQVTLLMIAFGVSGSILFGIPNVWCKAVGYLCWFLWFTMDVSDGQVARVTKTFSKFGTEMDYMAHLICHPLMNFAMWLTFLEMNIMNPILLSAIFMIIISAELVTRSLFEFTNYETRLSDAPRNGSAIKKSGWFKYIVCDITLYPTLIVCFSWLIVLDYALDNGFSLLLFLMWGTLYLVVTVRSIGKMLAHFYKG